MNMAKYVVGRQCEQCMEQMVSKTDEFLEKFQGGGGHFQSKNFYCRFLTFIKVFFGNFPKKLQ